MIAPPSCISSSKTTTSSRLRPRARRSYRRDPDRHQEDAIDGGVGRVPRLHHDRHGTPLRAHERRQPHEPAIALCGLDNAAGRRQLDHAGFDFAAEAGLGRGHADFRSMLIHTLPCAVPAAKLWEMTDTVEGTADAKAYRKLLEEGSLARCCVALLAGKAVDAPFVGAAAAKSPYLPGRRPDRRFFLRKPARRQRLRLGPLSSGMHRAWRRLGWWHHVASAPTGRAGSGRAARAAGCWSRS
jgi:hypothetical protein